MVIDTDGSAFITKAEFDSLKNNFQAQIDSYNSAIDSKIDGAIASYLSGIQVATNYTQEIPWSSGKVKFTNVPTPSFGWAPPCIYFLPFPIEINNIKWNATLISLTSDLFTRDLVDEDRALMLDNNVQVENMKTTLFSKNYAYTYVIQVLEDHLGSDWATAIKNMSVDERLSLAWDLLTYSQFVVRDINGHRCVLGIGRSSQMNASIVQVKCNAKVMQNAGAELQPESVPLFEISQNFGKTRIYPSMFKLRKTGTQFQNPSEVSWYAPHNTCSCHWDLSYDANIRQMAIRLRIGPFMTSPTRPIPSKWQDGAMEEFSGFWAFNICDNDQIATTSEWEGHPFDTSYNNNTTIFTIRYPWRIPTGKASLDTSSKGCPFDYDTLWCAAPIDSTWLTNKLPSWLLGSGLGMSGCENVNIEDVSSYGGIIRWHSENFSNVNDPVYYDSRVHDCGSFDDYSHGILGALPILKLSALENDKSLVTDFYAPLYAEDNMSTYGKTYIDGAVICKTTEEGELSVKLKSSEPTTLYFSEGPFTTADGTGNVAYTANSVNKLAGEGASVPAGDVITVVIHNVEKGKKYYVKPSSATTINFLSAEIVKG